MPAMNPFNGRCIHGEKGAKMIRGSLISLGCKRCLRMLPSREKEAVLATGNR